MSGVGNRVLSLQALCLDTYVRKSTDRDSEIHQSIISTIVALARSCFSVEEGTYAHPETGDRGALLPTLFKELLDHQDRQQHDQFLKNVEFLRIWRAPCAIFMLQQVGDERVGMIRDDIHFYNHVVADVEWSFNLFGSDLIADPKELRAFVAKNNVRECHRSFVRLVQRRRALLEVIVGDVSVWEDQEYFLNNLPRLKSLFAKYFQRNVGEIQPLVQAGML